jgi:predicted amidohydrolase YtcJ
MGNAADLLFANGTVFSAGADRSRSAGVAVKDGRILAVARDEYLTDLVDPHTEVVDLEGGLVVPGLQDAHVHPVMAGVDMLRCELHGTQSAQECLDRVAAYAAANPSTEWITGGGWSMEFFPGGTPNRQLLDAVVPDRPVILTNRDGHGAWVNTEAGERVLPPQPDHARPGVVGVHRGVCAREPPGRRHRPSASWSTRRPRRARP